MVIIRLRGGLGNQMFQYAMGRRMALQLNVPLTLDLTSLLKESKKEGVTNRAYQLHIFEIEESFLIQPKWISFLYKNRLNVILQLIKFIKLIGIRKFKEVKFTVDGKLVNQPLNDCLYSGYWQSERYFSDAGQQLRKDFIFKGNLSQGAQGFADKIKTTNSVCVHVRRGDYVDNAYFQTMDLNYYQKGAQYLNKNTLKPHFFIFSDDTDWCKNNIKFDHDYTIVDYETDNLRYKEDLQLMAACNHFIISPSSFSWWAVWLGAYRDKVVIAPKSWFANDFKDVSDLMDESWIKL